MLVYLSGNFVSSLRNLIALLLLLPFAQACTPKSVIAVDTVDNAYSSPLNVPAVPVPRREGRGVVAQGVCTNNIKTTRANGLVAERITLGHTHYIEFRVRDSPAIPSGHLHVVYGELDEQATPSSFNYVGLFPKGSVFGLYTGIFLPIGISGELEPSVLDCHFKPAGAYRVSINAKQYQRLLNRIDEHRQNPPDWRMLSYNCNHFAAELGEVVGLKSPKGERSSQFLSFVYFRQLLRANAENHSRPMANGGSPTN